MLVWRHEGNRVRMRRGALLAWLGIAVLIACAALAASGGAASRPAAQEARGSAAAPVSTLDPAGTARDWRRLVTHKPTVRAQASCRPLRAVFYAATDWLRLATRLAASPSPCAQYYVSIPPLVSDKTKPRPDQAWRIRALGPNFHAMAEIHWTTWSRWVASTGSTWYQAGVEARRRMAPAGYDVTKGDIWARPVRRRRRGCGPGRRLHRRRGAALDGDPALPGQPSELADRRRLLVGHGRACQRLVAGGLRGLPELRRPGRTDRDQARLPQRLPPARARAGRSRPAVGRRCARIHPEHLQSPSRRRRTRCAPSAPQTARHRITGASPGSRGMRRAFPPETLRHRPSRSSTASPPPSATPASRTRPIPEAERAGRPGRTSSA